MYRPPTLRKGNGAAATAGVLATRTSATFASETFPLALLTYSDLRKAANVDFSLDDHDPAAGPRHGLHLSLD
jgi:hypothetical protein